MTRYSDTDYAERYYVTFKDIKGVTWRVSIQAPKFEGTAIPLQGSDVPFEWEGQGDEDLTNTIFGSTGTLRVIATKDTKSAFAQGALYPTAINDRRVVVTRGSFIMWIGYIEVQSYDQPWDAVPYEMELSVKSPLALADDFPMPEYGSWESEPIYTYQALAFVLQSMGFHFSNLITNVATYKDFYGNTVGTDVNWIDMQLNMAIFYDWSNGKYAANTIGDFLKWILAPYGHIREMFYNKECNIGIFHHAYSSKELYSGAIGTNSLERKMWDYQSEMNMSALTILSTDNTLTNVQAPASVSYSKNTSTHSDIIKLDNSMVHVKAYKDEEHSDGDFDTRDSHFDGEPSYRERVLFPYKNSENTTDLSAYIGFYHNSTKLANFLLGRIFHYSNSDLSYTASLCDLGIACSGDRTVTIVPKQQLRTVMGYNKLKLTVKVHNVDNSEDPVTGSNLQIQVLSNGKYLFYNSQTGIWTWGSTSQSFTAGDVGDGILFSTPRSEYSDLIWITLKEDSGIENCTTICELTLEYVEDTNVYGDTSNVKKAQMALAGIYGSNETEYVGGGGDEIEATFNSLCGQRYSKVTGCFPLFGGFLDQKGLIDTSPRKMLDLAEARNDDDVELFQRAFVYVIDNSDKYICVANGMNARNCACKLKLVTTNLTL